MSDRLRAGSDAGPARLNRGRSGSRRKPTIPANVTSASDSVLSPSTSRLDTSVAMRPRSSTTGNRTRRPQSMVANDSSPKTPSPGVPMRPRSSSGRRPRPSSMVGGSVLPETPTTPGERPAPLKRAGSLRAFAVLDRDDRTVQREAAEKAASEKKRKEEVEMEAEQKAKQQDAATIRAKAQLKLANERSRVMRRKSGSETSLDVAVLSSRSFTSPAQTEPKGFSRNSSSRGSGRRKNLPTPAFSPETEIKGGAAVEQFDFVVNRGSNPLGFSIKPAEDAPYSLVVDRLKSSGAAQVAGVQSGDYILAVDDTDTSTMTKPEAMSILKGSGETVHLRIGRLQRSRTASFRRATSQTDIRSRSNSQVNLARSRESLSGMRSRSGSMRSLPTRPPAETPSPEAKADQITTPKNINEIPKPETLSFDEPVNLENEPISKPSLVEESSARPPDSAPPPVGMDSDSSTDEEETAIDSVSNENSTRQEAGKTKDTDSDESKMATKSEVTSTTVNLVDVTTSQSSVDVENVMHENSSLRSPSSADVKDQTTETTIEEAESRVNPPQTSSDVTMRNKNNGSKARRGGDISRATVLWSDDTADIMSQSLPSSQPLGQDEIDSRPLQFGRLITELSRHDFAGFKREWQDIMLVGQKLMSTESEDPANSHKNRYSNIKAYDATRVTLPQIGDDPNSGYINANYIKTTPSSTSQRYIATQGPKPSTFETFWRMMWETKSPIIVMLTKEVENSRTKCDRYWPDPIQPQMAYGDIIVSIESTANRPDHVMRELILQQGNTTHTVTQFCYTGWPENGVPEDGEDFLSFLQIVNNFVQNKFGEKISGPIVVHDSAGVGRTGVFIGASAVLREERQETGLASVFDVVSSMRMCRTQMVQSLAQYIFLYKVHAAIISLIESTMDAVKEEANPASTLESETKLRPSESSVRKRDSRDSRSDVDVFERMRIHIPDSDCPIQYTTLMASPGMTAAEVLSAAIKRIPAIHLIPRRTLLVRLGDDGISVVKRYADQDEIGPFDSNEHFELQPKLDVSDICALNCNIEVLHTEKDSVEVKVRDETTAANLVALVLSRTSCDHPAENYVIQVKAGPRGGKRYLEGNELYLSQPSRTCTLALASEARGAPTEVVEGLTSEIKVHKSVISSQADKIRRLSSAHSAAEAELVTMRSLEIEIGRLRDEIETVQGQAATDRQQLEFAVTQAARDSKVKLESEMEKSRSTKTALTDAKTKLETIERENERLRYYEKRVGVIEDTNTTLRDRMKEQSKKDKDMRQGYDRLYADKAKRDGQSAASVAMLQESLKSKEILVQHLQNEYDNVTEELTKTRLSNAHFQVLMRMQSPGDRISGLPDAAQDELAVAEALTNQIATLERELKSASLKIEKLKKNGGSGTGGMVHGFNALCNHGRVIRSVALNKGESGGLGISLIYRQTVDPNDPRQGVHVKGVKDGSVAHKEGVLTNDQLLEVNGISVIGKTREEVLKILKGMKSPVNIAFARVGGHVAVAVAKGSQAELIKQQLEKVQAQLKASVDQNMDLKSKLARSGSTRSSKSTTSDSKSTTSDSPDLATQEKTIADLRSKLDQAEQAIGEMQSKLKRSNSQSSIRSEEGAMKMKTELRAALETINDLNSELEIKQLELDGLASNSVASKERADEMEESLSYLRKDALKYQETLDEARRQLEDLETQSEKKLADAKTRYDTLEADLKFQIESLHSQVAEQSGINEKQKKSTENEKSELARKLEAAELRLTKVQQEHEILVAKSAGLESEATELSLAKSSVGEQVERLEKDLEASKSKEKQLQYEVETLQRVLEDQASGRSEQVQVLRQQLANQLQHFTAEKETLEMQMAEQRQQYEHMFRQAAAESEARHEQVDAQNAQLRTMLEASKQHVAQQQAELQTRMTMLQSMQAERDHLSKAMRQQLAQTMRRPIMSTKDDDSDDDEEIKENLAAKTEEANKLQTLVDQISDMVKEKAPDLLGEVDVKYQRILGKQRSRAASFRRSTRKSKSQQGSGAGRRRTITSATLANTDSEDSDEL